MPEKEREFEKKFISPYSQHYSESFRQAFTECGDITALIAKTKELLASEADQTSYLRPTLQHIIDIHLPNPEDLIGNPNAARRKIIDFCRIISDVSSWDLNVLAAANDRVEHPYPVTGATQEMLQALANEFFDRSNALMRGVRRASPTEHSSGTKGGGLPSH